MEAAVAGVRAPTFRDLGVLVSDHTSRRERVGGSLTTVLRRVRGVAGRALIRGLLAVLGSISIGCVGAAEPGDVPAPPPPLQRKLEEITRRVPAWVAAGGDHSRVASLGQQVDTYLRGRRYQDAEAVADQILGVLNEQAGKSALRPHRRRTTPVAPATLLPREHAPGLRAFTDMLDMFESLRMNVFGFPVNWRDLEPSRRVYELDESFKPLTLVVPRYPGLEAVVLVVRMLDTNARPMPADLATRRFNDPELVERFNALIDAVAKQPGIARVTHVLLGNEVDAYLASHRDEAEDFAFFFRRAAEHVRLRLPGVRVGTILTHDGVRGQLDLFRRLKADSDFVDYTYYPIGAQWRMRPVREVEADLAFLAQQAGDKPFAFTEIGYSASHLNGSSEARQADFVRAVFRALGPSQRAGRIEFILYHALYDYPPGFCRPYAAEQGIGRSDQFCAFVEHLGLRSYATGKPRPAWDAFVEGARRWMGGAPGS